MSHNPRFTLNSSIKNVSISHRGCQVIHDSFLRNKLQITRPLYPTKTITYKQNALNQRVSKLVNGQVVEKYLWKDLTTLLSIYDKDDNLKQRFEYADQRMPISMTSNGQKYYLHYDQVGSLRAVTDTSHNIVKEISYDTFGKLLSDSNPSFTVPFEFAGGLYDTDSKLTRFGYRDYDAYTGKWTAKDPIGFSGGDSNLYGYVLGDPVGFVDPKGLKEWPWTDVDYDKVSYLYCSRGYGSALTYCSGFFYTKNAECRGYLDRINSGLEDPKCKKRDDNETCTIPIK